MKKIFAMTLLLLLMAGCSTKPEIMDNGEPGQIKVVVFLDENRNGVKDQGESGLIEKVGFSQDISCPAGNLDKVTVAETDSTGETEYNDLKPGIYCVMYMGPRASTTKLTVEVHLSSEQEALIAFGVTE